MSLLALPRFADECCIKVAITVRRGVLKFTLVVDKNKTLHFVHTVFYFSIFPFRAPSLSLSFPRIYFLIYHLVLIVSLRPSCKFNVQMSVDDTKVLVTWSATAQELPNIAWCKEIKRAHVTTDSLKSHFLRWILNTDKLTPPLEGNMPRLFAFMRAFKVSAALRWCFTFGTNGRHKRPTRLHVEETLVACSTPQRSTPLALC